MSICLYSFARVDRLHPVVQKGDHRSDRSTQHSDELMEAQSIQEPFGVDHYGMYVSIHICVSVYTYIHMYQQR